MRQLKIAVVGNCQSAGIADCLNLLDPGVRAVPFMVHVIRQQNRDQAFEHTRKYDIILSQPVKSFGSLNTDNLLTLGKPLYTFPNVYFRGYTPDICFIGPGGSRVRTPLANNNSYIILESYLRGLSQAECLARFNPETYAELGYPDAWKVSLETLRLREAGLDIKASRFFEDPEAPPNLYVSNHPKLYILYDLAKQALERLGRPEPADVTLDCVPDRLLEGSIWPIYGTGRSCDTPNEKMRFKASGMRYFTLPEFIAASYASYTAADRSALVINSPPEIVELAAHRLGAPA